MIGIFIVASIAYSVGYKAGKATLPKAFDAAKYRKELIEKYVDLSMQAAKINPELEPLKSLQLTEASENVLKAVYAAFPNKENQ